MVDITLIFPDQLFEKHPCINSSRLICLAEEFLYFKAQLFHKQRIILLKAAMQAYAESLVKSKKKVLYIASNELNCRGDLFALLAKKRVKSIHLAEFADEWLTQDLEEAVNQYGWTLHYYRSPGFLCSQEEVKTCFTEKEHFSMAHFYMNQRKKHEILMEGSKPLGGKYSFDTENRKKIPKKIEIPSRFIPESRTNIEKIINEVESEFPKLQGLAEPFLYPTTHREARKALEIFLKERLCRFGDYQDAIQMENSFLFHSVLSPLINIGLLTPQEVVHATLVHAKRHLVPMNSLEGFIRQIMGWREFVRAVYVLKGSRERSLNFFKHKKKISKCFWKGSTGILPIDNTVKQVLKTGYCNHIERLMILGNFLLLTETAPHEVYKWFMGHFVDAYDWVMVPNVYGMSQYSDGGMIVTKPYISGSNYILKMSNYPKEKWTEVWDGLFWRFLHLHQSVFASNPRTLALIHLFKRNETNFLTKIRKAERWLSEYRSI
ncbi:MAG: cryptochrome/photolyase family protein [Rhabdochlamydiaceae bacterium]|nr:cryptochrome/photolyase family protein [Rhabdochlamydiaceae bacterium]